MTNLISTILLMACLSISKSCTLPDLDLLCFEVMAEAGGDGSESMEAVTTVILNRKASPEFPDTISEVINQKSQFCDPACYYTEDCKRAVYRAIIRYGSDRQIVPYTCYYFRADYYHDFGIPYTHYGNTYFSLSEEATD